MEYERRPCINQQLEAEKLTQQCFDLIKQKKTENGIYNPLQNGYANGWMLGEDFTEITTTLGSLEAKRISLNPEFAGLIVLWLNEAEIVPGDTIGLVLSGSFPALAISTLAATEIMDVNVVVLSSLGASMYGANQPMANWADMETWLNESNLLHFKSEIMTIGAENDNGGGLMEDGVEDLKEAARRNGMTLFISADLDESIMKKTDFLLSRNIKLLVNIGGNQAALGYCTNTSTIPNGLNIRPIINDSYRRGIIARISEKNIPFIHLLNIKDLASDYEIDIDPGMQFNASHRVHHIEKANKIHSTLAIVFIIGLVVGYNIIQKRTTDRQNSKGNIKRRGR